MPVDLSEVRKRAERDGQIQGGDTFKFHEGRNIIRILTTPRPHPGMFNGKRNFKWLAYILDRDQGDVKLFFMPHTVFKQLEAFSQSEDYAFDEFPMPYDIAITAKNAGTIDVEYTVIAARKNVPLTEAEQTMFKAKKPLEEVQEALFAKAAAAPQTAPEAAAHFDPDEVPF